MNYIIFITYSMNPFINKKMFIHQCAMCVCVCMCAASQLQGESGDLQHVCMCVVCV